MNLINTSWDDPSGNRSIDLQVDCQATETGIDIHQIVPTKVVIQSDDGSTRSIGVHTDAGRRLLVSKIDQQSVATTIQASTAALPLVDGLGSPDQSVTA